MNPTPVPRTPVQRWVLSWIDRYQRAFAGRPSPCRFFPSCSQYAREAVEVHGARRGLWLSSRRLLRCRPFGPSGFDPVPACEHPRPAVPAASQPVRRDV